MQHMYMFNKIMMGTIVLNCQFQHPIIPTLADARDETKVGTNRIFLVRMVRENMFSTVSTELVFPIKVCNIKNMKNIVNCLCSEIIISCIWRVCTQ